jgi:GH15 family glucan-1,4-alpha-glucosidase
MARIEDYAMIGDCRTAALVCRDGSIDWLCLPRFDSSSCFAALLGNRDNGRWLIAPKKKPKKIERRYRDCTMVLETTVTTADGRVRVVDFMPSDTPNISIVRMVTGLSGEVEMRTEIVIRFDHGLTIPWVSRVAPHTWSAIAGPHLLVLRAPVPLKGRDMRTVGAFAIRKGQTVSFALAYGESHLAAPEAIDATVELERTERFWRDWSAACKAGEPSRGEIIRSLVTLKALTYRPTGGMVAAPTTSLPEFLGGERNWDYRYCWLRDATFTLLAFMNAGLMEEARNWRDWLMRVLAGAPSQVQPLYGIAGERRLDEWTVPWLQGYENSSPVRVGNAASLQVQLDIFGELADVLSQARRGGLPEAKRGNEIRKAFLQHLEKIWRDPDEGIWEIRGEPRHFTHSKVMAWCAFDRASKAARADKADKRHWTKIAREIHADVCSKGIDKARNCFVQSYGSKRMDASLLMLAIVGFLPADDVRIANTVAELERQLLFDGLLLRYESETGIDGLPPGEGVFLACSFWLADVYILLGRLKDAKRLFERLTLLANDVGLYAEEYDPRSRRMLGNFPQAFSHVALVNTALNLMHARQRTEPVQRHTD